MHKQQILHFGEEAILKFSKLLEKDSPKKIFLVTGKESFKKSGADLLFSNILFSYELVQFSEFTENPKSEDVQKGVKLFKKNNCDYIIAIGGGSVIDMAKLINIGQANEGTFKDLILGKREISNCGKKLVAVPTTSGAGSEATHFAVVYLNSLKYSLAHKKFIMPDYVFLFPKLSYSLSKYQTAVSGFDALAQSIESYWSVDSNLESKNIAFQAIEKILFNLSLAVNKNDPYAKKEMLLASYLSGKAINISKTTGPHAMAYIFTTKFNIPHGHAVALTFLSWFKININCNHNNLNDKRGLTYVRENMNSLSKLIERNSTYTALEVIDNLIKDIGLETRLSKLGVLKSNFDEIIYNLNQERLKNNPVKVLKEDLLEILHSLY